MPFPFLLAAIAGFTVVSAAYVFLCRSLMRSVLALASASAGGSLLFIYMGMTLVAILQLLVIVGGLSTYLMVSVASEEKRVGAASRLRFLLAAAVVFAALSPIAFKAGAGQAAGNDFAAIAGEAFASYYALLYASALMLFAAVVGSIIIIRKYMRLVV